MKLRLLKVIVQPVFALDDDETLTEQPGEAVVVPPAEWPTFATERFAQGFEALRAQVEGETRLQCVGKVAQCPDCGAHPGEYCDQTCGAHAGGTCMGPGQPAPRVGEGG